MQFEYESQRFQDWLSQRWVMWRGRRIDPAEFPWLMGPFGNVDVIADRYVERLVEDENLVVERDVEGAGLLFSFDELQIEPDDLARMPRAIADFYEHTSRYDIEFWSEWSPFFRPFGSLIQLIYSRRLQQLNLPMRPMEASRGVTSDIILLRDAETGTHRYTLWYRILKSTGRVIYSGIYTTCSPPDGPTSVKVVFPLPRGNATVILSPDVDEEGRLHLTSGGSGFGSPGFYFLLVDKKGRYWAQYIKSFKERISLFVDEESVLRTDHLFRLWGRRVLQLHYRMSEREKPHA